MTFDSYIQSVTQDKIMPKVVDTILGGNVLSMRVLSDGRPWSGETVKVPFKYQKNSTSQGSFDGFDTFDTTKVNTRQTMSFKPTGYYQSVVLSGMEVDVNATKAQVLDLVKVEMESGMQDMMDSLGTIFYGSNASTPKNFLGLQDIVDDGTSVSSYGGKSRSTYSGLAATITDVSGDLTLALMGTSHDAASVGAHRPTLGIAAETVWGYYEQLAQPTINTNVDGMGYAKVTRDGIVRPGQGLRGELGYDALFYRGMPLVRDEKCTAQYLYMLNEDSLQWHGLKSHKYSEINLSAKYHEGNQYDAGSVPKSYGFHWTGLKEPTNQYAEIGQIILLGQLIGKNPRLNSVMTNITGV